MKILTDESDAPYAGVEQAGAAAPIGRKDDGGKLRWQLLRRGCVHALEGVIRVLMYGAKKYGDDNWKDVDDAERRYRDALDRHLADIDKGIEFDADTGEDNWFHVATNALFVAELRAAKRAAKPAKADKREEPWRKHTPGRRPEGSLGLRKVECKLRDYGDEVLIAHPARLCWGAMGPSTITFWRPRRG